MSERVQAKVTIFLTVLLSIVFFVLGIVITFQLTKSEEPEITTSVVSERLTAISGLATARLDYRGIIHYEEGSIPLIDKKSFNMLYEVHITAGIDFNKIVVEVKDREIDIKIPKAEVQTLVVDPDSIEFYDEVYALFNWEGKGDTVVAIQEAQKDAKAKVDQSELLDSANQQAKILIEQFIRALVEDNKKDPYTVKVTN